MHLVHLRADLGSLEEGTKEADGLAVLSVLFDLVDNLDAAAANAGIAKIAFTLGGGIRCICKWTRGNSPITLGRIFQRRSRKACPLWP